MKWFIASDLHGSEYYTMQMISAFNRENADRLLLLGDILYHGPRNDLPKDYAPKAVIEILTNMLIKFFVSEEIVIQKLIKWFLIFLLWRIMQLFVKATR